MTELEKLKAEIKAEIMAEMKLECAKPVRNMTAVRSLRLEMDNLMAGYENAHERYVMRTAIQTVVRMALGKRYLSHLTNEDLPTAVEIVKEVLDIASRYKKAQDGGECA